MKVASVTIVDCSQTECVCVAYLAWPMCDVFADWVCVCGLPGMAHVWRVRRLSVCVWPTWHGPCVTCSQTECVCVAYLAWPMCDVFADWVCVCGLPGMAHVWRVRRLSVCVWPTWHGPCVTCSQTECVCEAYLAWPMCDVFADWVCVWPTWHGPCVTCSQTECVCVTYLAWPMCDVFTDWACVWGLPGMAHVWRVIHRGPTAVPQDPLPVLRNKQLLKTHTPSTLRSDQIISELQVLN